MSSGTGRPGTARGPATWAPSTYVMSPCAAIGSASGEERGITPVIWWQPTNPANPAQGLYGRHERTLAGKHDAYLIEWARATRAAGEATGKPILPPVRARSHGRVVPVVGRRLDNTKENDKAAWRHVWRIFKWEGALPWVRFVWSTLFPYQWACPGDQ